MICCKITTNYQDPNGNFEVLMEKLSNLGECLWSEGNLYFSDVVNDKTNHTTVGKILKKAGYKQFYILEYSRTVEPNEDDSINSWIFDKLIKINYQQCERQSQKTFHEISKGLDILDSIIDQFEEARELQNKEDELDGRNKEETN